MELYVGQKVRVEPYAGHKLWQAAVVVRKYQFRRYRIKLWESGRLLYRNRRQLRPKSAGSHDTDDVGDINNDDQNDNENDNVGRPGDPHSDHHDPNHGLPEDPHSDHHENVDIDINDNDNDAIHPNDDSNDINDESPAQPDDSTSDPGASSGVTHDDPRRSTRVSVPPDYYGNRAPHRSVRRGKRK